MYVHLNLNRSVLFMRPTVILFDVGNVILLANHKITHEILCKEYEVPAERAAKFFENEDYRNFSRGMIDGEEFYKRLVQNYLKTDLSYEEVVAAHDRHIYDVDSEVVEIIKSLSPKIRLGFVTDTNLWQTRREREMIDLARFSKEIFRSYESGMIKNDEGFFPYLLKVLGLKPSEILLIDDSPEKIKRAQENGFLTHTYENADKLKTFLKPV